MVPAYGMALPYPLTINIKKKKIDAKHIRDLCFGKFLRSQSRAKEVLAVIEKLKLKIPKEYKDKVKAKKLKLFMDGHKV